MHSWRLLPVALLATLALTGCEKENAAAPAAGPLLATHWLLTQVDDQAVQPDPATSQAYLEFVKLGSCTVGLGPCNNFSGRFRLGSAGQLHISAPIPTHAACPSQALETQYLDNLARTTRYLIRNDELRLYDDGSARPRLVFRRASR